MPWAGRAALLLLLLLRMRQAPATELEGDRAPAQALRFLSPQPWAVVRLWGEELPVRVDARDFRAEWLDLGCSLTLLAHGVCAERARACRARACTRSIHGHQRGRGEAACRNSLTGLFRRRGHRGAQSAGHVQTR